MLSGYHKPQRTAVFISGGGSTLQAILEMQYQLGVNLVVSNRKSALGLLKARRHGVPLAHMHKQMSYCDLQTILETYRIERIILAGFMKLLPAEFVQRWQGRIVNIHPSLLPHFPGIDSARRSWQAGAEMGVTIHEVNEQMDAGKPVLQMCSGQSDKNIEYQEAEIFLRRTEQSLLREMVLRYF